MLRRKLRPPLDPPQPLPTPRKARVRGVRPSQRGAVLAWAKTLPEMWRGSYLRAYRRSKTAAVRAVCQGCAGWENVRRHVTGCQERSCAFHPWRPYTKEGPHPVELTIEGLSAPRQKLIDKAGTSRAAAVKLYCLQCMGGVDAAHASQLVRECATPTCPLYPHRPYKFPAEKDWK